MGKTGVAFLGLSVSSTISSQSLCGIEPRKIRHCRGPKVISLKAILLAYLDRNVACVTAARQWPPPLEPPLASPLADVHLGALRFSLGTLGMRNATRLFQQDELRYQP